MRTQNHAGTIMTIARLSRPAKDSNEALAWLRYLATDGKSPVGKLLEPQAALQRKAAYSQQAVLFTMPGEAIALDQERRGDLHAVARQAKILVIKVDERGGIGNTARSRKDGDAIGSQRIRHGFHVRYPRKRSAKRGRVTRSGCARRTGRRHRLGVNLHSRHPSDYFSTLAYESRAIALRKVSRNTRETHETRMRFIIGGSFVRNSTTRAPRITHGAERRRPNRDHIPAYARTD